MADYNIVERSQSEIEISRMKAKRGMRSQVIMFSLMIFLTLLSFSIVLATKGEVVNFSVYYAIPVILLFAAVQVGLQLFYFMHMNEEGHGVPQMFMFVGALMAFVFILGIITISWW